MTARQWTERVTWSVASALGTSTRAGMMLGHRVRAHLAIVLRVAAVVGVEFSLDGGAIAGRLGGS